MFIVKKEHVQQCALDLFLIVFGQHWTSMVYRLSIALSCNFLVHSTQLMLTMRALLVAVGTCVLLVQVKM